MEDLKEAITCNHEAIGLHPLDFPDRPVFLNNLASAIFAHYKQLGCMEDPEKAITYNRKHSVFVLSAIQIVSRPSTTLILTSVFRPKSQFCALF